MALVLAGTACAGLPSALQRGTGTEYTVVAPVLAAPGRPIYACYFIFLPDPPLNTCGGVEIRNVDVAMVAALGGDHPFRGGTRMSGSVRLVGTWDGQALTLTRWPVPVAHPPASPLPPSPVAPLPPPSGQAAAAAEAARIAGDLSLRSEGAQVMTVGVGQYGEDVDVWLVVADARAIQALHHHYDSVHVIGGWLQPVSPASRS